MTDNFNIVNDSDRLIIIQKLSVMLNEKEEVIESLIPVWNSIVLASVLRLTINNNRFSALQNFLTKRTIPSKDISNFKDSSNQAFSKENILDFGESFMGVLIPDKKSALATVLSQDLNSRSSLILKGLSVFFALYGDFFANVSSHLLVDWKSFADFFGNYKNNIFDVNIPPKVQKSISEILLISEIYKESNSHLLVHNDDVDSGSVHQIDDENRFYNSKKFIFVFLLVLLFGIIGAYFYLNKNVDSEVVNNDTEELIPVDTLNKLNDSLSKAVVVDSSQLKVDSVVTLMWWPKGKEFKVANNSSLVKLYQYVNDSSQVESIQIPTFEFSFDNKTDQIVNKNDMYFKYLVEGLNKFKNVKVRIFAFSDNSIETALKRGFLLKNRLVGEGLSPKRIEVKYNRNVANPDMTKPMNEQVVLEFKKRNY
jgi:hypothetical protein